MNFAHHHHTRLGASVLVFLLALGTLSAQAPRTITYQGLLVDPSGTFIPNGTHTLTLALYEASTGGSAIWNEAQSVVSVNGLFNAMLGSATPIPTTLRFDRAYWLGVSVDGGAELAPRTPLSAVPYALYATTAGEAKSLAPDATGVVTSINGGEGAITITGGGATTVNRTGNTITISSSGGSGGSGIQGIQSSDAAIAIGNGSGPIASLALIDGGIGGNKLATDAVTTDKIANGAVTASKLASGVIPTIPPSLPPNGAAGGDLAGSYPNPTVAAVQGRPVANTLPTTGQVMKWNGTAWAPSADAALTLPYADSVNTAGVNAFRVANTATTGNYTHAILGQSGAAQSLPTTASGVVGTASAGNGVLGQSYGGGSGVFGYGYFGAAGVSGVAGQAGHGVDAGASGSGNAVNATIFGSGTGKAGNFAISNTANTNNALEATTNGSGSAGSFTLTSTSNVDTTLVATSAGQGGAGRFELTSASNTSPALSGVSNSTTGYGSGVLGTIPNTSSTGSNSGAGVMGIAVGASTGNANAGVWGSHYGGGPGVFGVSVNGPGVLAQANPASGVGTALDVRNGAIKVSGTNKAAFTHTATAANKLSLNGTDITNPMCDGDPNAILIVTQRLATGGTPYNNSAVGVYYNTVRNKWEIFNQTNTAIPNGAQFNVLVIKQ